MTLKIGCSPCPNDTFIFDAIANNKIDTKGIRFEFVLEDVETLNQWSDKGRLDITKLSFPSLFRQSSEYVLLNSGAALGMGVGPLLIARSMVSVPDIAHCTIAIPGAYTTANFLLSHAFPEATNRTPMLFSQIEDAVLQGRFDLGVIIHENRFTYREKGLIRICDLGEVWEKRRNLPVPLGCIAAKRTLGRETHRIVNQLIKESLQYAFAQYPDLPLFVLQHATEMDPTVMRQHIQLYVNDYTLDLGENGKEAISVLYELYREQERIPFTDLFLS